MMKRESKETKDEKRTEVKSNEDKTVLNSGVLKSSTNSPSSQSSARCLLLRAAKSFKDILAFLSETDEG